MTDVIFLDVDGVLNAFHCTLQTARYTGHTRHEVAGFALWLRADDGARLASIAPIVWATTWVTVPELDDIAELVGLPRGLPRISHVDYASGKTCGKLRGVGDFLTLNRDVTTFAWIDDALSYQDSDFMQKWRRQPGCSAFGLIPDPVEGLTVHDFEVLENFFSA